MSSKRGFTLVELMVVVLIVSILAAVAIPLLSGRIDSAKWSEANAGAGTVRTAVRAYAAEQGIAAAQLLSGKMDVAATQAALGFSAADLTGTYFVPGDYNIDSVNANGIAVITVTGSQGNAPSGSYTLNAAGTWVKN